MLKQPGGVTNAELGGGGDKKLCVLIVLMLKQGKVVTYAKTGGEQC